MKVNLSTTIVDSLTYDQQNIEPAKRDPRLEKDNSANVVKDAGIVKDDKEGLNKAEIKVAVEKLNQTVRAFNKRFHFSIHEGTHRVMVQIIDTATGKVINEIPPKKVLDIVASMNELLGLIIDERV